MQKIPSLWIVQEVVVFIQKMNWHWDFASTSMGTSFEVSKKRWCKRSLWSYSIQFQNPQLTLKSGSIKNPGGLDHLLRIFFLVFIFQAHKGSANQAQSRLKIPIPRRNPATKKVLQRTHLFRQAGFKVLMPQMCEKTFPVLWMQEIILQNIYLLKKWKVFLVQNPGSSWFLSPRIREVVAGGKFLSKKRWKKRFWRVVQGAWEFKI